MLLKISSWKHCNRHTANQLSKTIEYLCINKHAKKLKHIFININMEL